MFATPIIPANGAKITMDMETRQVQAAVQAVVQVHQVVVVQVHQVAVIVLLIIQAVAVKILPMFG